MRIFRHKYPRWSKLLDGFATSHMGKEYEIAIGRDRVYFYELILPSRGMRPIYDSDNLADVALIKNDIDAFLMVGLL